MNFNFTDYRPDDEDFKIEIEQLKERGTWMQGAARQEEKEEKTEEPPAISVSPQLGSSSEEECKLRTFFFINL
jgi:hypothetical protein